MIQLCLAYLAILSSFVYQGSRILSCSRSSMMDKKEALEDNEACLKPDKCCKQLDITDCLSML